MPANLISDLWISGFGTPAASGSVAFYQPGTLVPVTVYQDDATTRVLTQPVALDANGRSVFPIYTTVPVRMIIQNAQGATLEDTTRVNGTLGQTTSLVNTAWPKEATVDAAFSALATSLGGKDGNVQASGTGAVSRTLQSFISERISVKSFGAVGNGSTDDTAAIQNAINYANTIGGGEVYFPAAPNGYLISATLNMTTNGVSLKGTGPLSSIIICASSMSSANAILATGSRYYIEDIGITHQSTSTLAAIALNQSDSASPPQGYGSHRRLRITNFRVGFAIGGRKHSFEHCDIVTDGNAASLGYAFAAVQATGTMIIGGTIDAGASGGNCIDFSGTLKVQSTCIIGVLFFQGSIGINFNTNAANVYGVLVGGCTFPGSAVATTVSIGTNAGSASGPGVAAGTPIIGFFDTGNSDLGSLTFADNSSGQGNIYTTPTWLKQPRLTMVTSLSLANGALPTPSLAYGTVFYYKYTGINGGTVTVQSPTPPSPKTSYSGTLITFIFDNQGAGTVTFDITTAAVFRNSGNVAPSNTKAIVVQFVYQNDTSKWIETYRGAAV